MTEQTGGVHRSGTGAPMGFHNPDMPWSELERTALRPATGARDAAPARGDPLAVDADGGDSPAWSRKRRAVPARRSWCRGAAATVPYAELHCHTNFSFLDGASHPEELAEEAARLGLTALAVTDHDGFYGVVRFAEAARELGLPTIFGAELSLGPARAAERRARPGRPAPAGARARPGGVRPAGPRPSPRPSCAAGRRAARSTATWRRSPPSCATTCWCSPAAARGTCRRRCSPRGSRRRPGELDRLTALFGAEHVAVELTDHGDPYDADRNDALADLAAAAGLPTVATNNVHYATPARRRLATALAAVRARRSLDEIDGWLPAAGHRPPAQRRGDGGPVRRATRARWRGPPSSAPSWPSTCNWSRRSCRRTRCRPGTPR